MRCGRAGQVGEPIPNKHLASRQPVQGSPGVQGTRPLWGEGRGLVRMQRCMSAMGVSPSQLLCVPAVSWVITQRMQPCFTSKVRREGLGLLWIPPEGQSLPMGAPVLSQPQTVPGAYPRPADVLPLLQLLARGCGQVAHSHSFRKEPFFQPASCSPWAPCVGAAYWLWGQGRTEQKGAPSHSHEGASSPPGR